MGMQVGDIVRVGTDCQHQGQEATISEIIDHQFHFIINGGQEDAGQRCWHTKSNLTPLLTVKSKTSGGIVSDIVKKVKELSLSADDRLLRRVGILDDCGDLTEQGTNVIDILLLDKFKSELVAKAKLIEAADKKEKK